VIPVPFRGSLPHNVNLALKIGYACTFMTIKKEPGALGEVGYPRPPKEKHVLLQLRYLASNLSQFVCHWSRMMSSTQKPRPPHSALVHIVIVLIVYTDEVKRVEQYEDKLAECHIPMDITGFLKSNPYINTDHRSYVNASRHWSGIVAQRNTRI